MLVKRIGSDYWQVKRAALVSSERQTEKKVTEDLAWGVSEGVDG
jgi:hypothetical protein